MLTYVNTLKLAGAEPVPVKCECQVTEGIGIHLIGLADAAVKESLLRVVTAMQALGYHIPGKKIVINLAPADLIKSGSGYDLAIALSVIAASEQENLPNLESWLILGEVALDGELRSVPGTLQAVTLAAKTEGIKSVIIPFDNAGAVEPFAGDIPVYPAMNLKEAVRIIQHPEEFPMIQDITLPDNEALWKPLPAFLRIRGNEGAKRAITIAAAGGHHLLLAGPVGGGKPTIAKAMLELMPSMTMQERLETALIYNASGIGYDAAIRPVRAPHYSSSITALIGGGTGERILPGEVSLAHNGLLIMDDLPEAPKVVMEVLRAPLEDRKVIISRLKSKVEFKANFRLAVLTSMCPCGYYGANGERCSCTSNQRRLYIGKLSGPVYDNIDIQAFVQEVNANDRLATQEEFDNAKEAVAAALEMQRKRYEGKPYGTNADVPASEIEQYVNLDENMKELLDNIMTHVGLSSRAYTRILRIARTIADLEGKEKVEPAHIGEASSYRFLDRPYVYGEKIKA